MRKGKELCVPNQTGKKGQFLPLHDQLGQQDMISYGVIHNKHF